MHYKNTFVIDPLEYFPYEISEQIFSYLPAKDLVRASEVSTLWYDFVASSRNLMKNVKLKISCNMDQDYSLSIMKAIRKSSRDYETIEIERCPYCMDSIYGLLLSKPWKNVIITNTCFANAEQALELFSLIEEDVESLVVTGVHVRFPYSNGKNKGLIFPNLRSLVVKNTQAFLFPEIFQNIQGIRHFDIFSNDQNVASLNAVLKFLKRNDKLEQLNISGRVFYQIMYEDISLTVPFKLKKLSVANGNYKTGDFYKRVYKNFASLINQQSECLEVVSLDDWMGEDILKAIYQLSKLKELTIKGFTHIYENNNFRFLGLTRNISIRKMSISMVPEDLSLLKTIIVASPNLTSLSISLMNFQFMDFIGKNATKLKYLSVGYLNVSFIPRRDLFKNLEILDLKDYRSCLRESVMRKSFQVLSDFERLLFFIMID